MRAVPNVISLDIQKTINKAGVAFLTLHEPHLAARVKFEMPLYIRHALAKYFVIMLLNQKVIRSFLSVKMRHLMTYQQNGMCNHRRLVGLGIHPLCSEYSLCAQWVAKDPSFLHVNI